MEEKLKEMTDKELLRLKKETKNEISRLDLMQMAKKIL